MAINTHIDISDGIKVFIEKALQKELEKEIDLALEIFEKRKGEIVAGVLVSVMKMTDMRIMEDRIVFEIRNKS